ncbi:Os03g0453051 [Oryza sativa Japonica Group]|uniref:Os03g0453051 protein n=1 Tax=Oryza sativa subsp. japonica TaxID=39947 RepID=A0A0P0VZX6_ORYSJ|nr:Os03g0453051 [Oryza sativa Japonica Group]
MNQHRQNRWNRNRRRRNRKPNRRATVNAALPPSPGLGAPKLATARHHPKRVPHGEAMLPVYSSSPNTHPNLLPPQARAVELRRKLRRSTPSRARPGRAVHGPVHAVSGGSKEAVDGRARPRRRDPRPLLLLSLTTSTPPTNQPHRRRPLSLIPPPYQRCRRLCLLEPITMDLTLPPPSSFPSGCRPCPSPPSPAVPRSFPTGRRSTPSRARPGRAAYGPIHAASGGSKEAVDG